MMAIARDMVKAHKLDESMEQAPAPIQAPPGFCRFYSFSERAPVIVQTWRAVRKQRRDVNEKDVRDALLGFDELWNELFPAEQARIVELLVERADLGPDRLDITLKVEGLTSLTASGSIFPP
ncbi:MULTISPECIES: hypothetical protein [Bradyrhizobium]|uniref:hypothetical protein n=1 Tax=Bradyrhizobium TaxID=374 RepID=UPI00067493B6|nr:hypothetical protein [Bradyrhizobium sp. CCBAU 15615]